MYITVSRFKLLSLVVAFLGAATAGLIAVRVMNAKHEEPKLALAPIVSPVPEASGNVLGTTTVDEKVSDVVQENDKEPVTVLVPKKNSPTPTPVSSSNSSSTSTSNSSNSTSNNSQSSNNSSTTTVPPTPSPVVHTTLDIFSGGTNVTVKNSSGQTSTGVQGQIINVGDTVTTGSDTRVQLLYPNGSVTRVDKNSSAQMSQEPAVDIGGKVEVVSGRLWNRVKKVAGAETPFQSESATVLATVRGTSFGHGIGFDSNNVAFDKIFTVEGRVEASCKNIAKTVTIDKDYQALISCIQNSVTDFLKQIQNLTDDDAQWILFNMQHDEELLNQYPLITYFDPSNPPASVSANLAPQVNAGVDQTITLPATVNLNGSVSDDGLPLGVAIQGVWTIDPAVVLNKPLIIANPLDLKTKVTFTTAGTYTFTLSATDVLKSSSDTVIITVLPAPPILAITSVNRTGNICILTSCTTNISVIGTAFANTIKAEASGTGLSTKQGTVVYLSDTLINVTFSGLTKNKTYNLRLYFSDGRQVTKTGAFNTNP